MIPRARGNHTIWEAELTRHDIVKVAKPNRETASTERFRAHGFPIGTKVKLGEFDEADGTWHCEPIDDMSDGFNHWVHEDCLEGGASEQEVAQAIASITGVPVPPSRPDQDPTVPFLQGYMVMGLTKDWRNGTLPLKVRNVEQLTGPDGTYLNHCTVITESGKRIRITFEEDA